MEGRQRPSFYFRSIQVLIDMCLVSDYDGGMSLIESAITNYGALSPEVII
jgi:hypothetical protein